MNEKPFVTHCNDSRRCFAKRYTENLCGILIPDKDGYSGYGDGECPFCKPIKSVTNGKVYPYNPPL